MRMVSTSDYGFWYWAKRYHDDFGPVICIQLVVPKGDSSYITEAYKERLRQRFRAICR